MKTITLLSMTAAPILFASSGARVYAASREPTVTVRYKDLNLNRTVDSPILYKRLTDVAEELCSSLNVSSEPVHSKLKAAHESCVQRALVGAVTRINQPAFTGYALTRLALPISQYALLTKK